MQAPAATNFVKNRSCAFLVTFGGASLFGEGALKRGNPPFFLPWQLIAGVFGLILFICLFAATLALIRVRRLEPAIVFRG